MKTYHKTSDKILVITLGCSKNTVDSERLMRQLSAHSLKIEYDKEKSDAQTVIINTCGFINDAKQQSIEIILNYVNAKRKGIITNLYVIGCLSQRYSKVLEKEIPEVDHYFGVNSIKDIIKCLGYNYKEELIGERLLSTPNHYAYLKISEGCNRKCSFCAIPLIKGKYKSEPKKNLVKEAQFLAKNGVKELILIAQDLSFYGKDIYGNSQLSQLIRQLSDIQEIEWIRLHYAYPAGFPKALAKVIKNNHKICKYLDIPFQHISDRMLKLMRRGFNKEKTLKLIGFLRDEIPNLALRTTLLVGYPGETEKDFNELVEFVKAIRFDRLGIFTYSHEEDTWVYKNQKDNVPAKVKQERADYIMKIQQSVSCALNYTKIGNIYRVLIDRIENRYFIGRTEFDSPDIDNEVLIPKNTANMKVGNYYNIKITSAADFDLIGEPSYEQTEL